MLCLGVVSAQEIMIVETDIIVPDSVIKIEVPDYVYVGNITWGFETQTEKIKIPINNTGTVDVEVYPGLVNPGGDVFSFLHFARRTTEPYQRIGNWSFNISAPAPGGVEEDYFYMKLDLSEYEGDFDESLLGHKADIEFIAVEH